MVIDCVFDKRNLRSTTTIMATETKKAPADIDLIAYDAPLSFPEPTSKWINARGGSLKSEYRETIPESKVPGKDLTGQWIIVSGSNNGIGREAALSFAKWGANLILACRNAPAHETQPAAVVDECLSIAKRAGHISEVEWWEIDMANIISIEAFAQRWLATGRPLDILCNNAGMGSSPGGGNVFKTKDGFEIIHQVNFLSHVLLTLNLLPSLAKASQPRIVCTTSCFHYLGKYSIANFNGGPGLGGLDGVQYYQNNKLYLQIWLTELQHRLLQHDGYKHITVNGVHPGYVNSGIWNLAGKGVINAIKQFAVKTAANVVGITPQQGSLAITHAATDPQCGPNPTTQGVGGPEGKGGARYFNRIYEQDPMPHTQDRDARLRVWRKVNEELHLQEKGLLNVLGLYSTE
nr:retinol dehydrogenase 13 [Quercus suber]